MTAKSKNNLIQFGTYAGAIVAVLTLAGVIWGNIIIPKIDDRIDCKTKYMVLLLQQMATPEQKKKADEEMNRWNKQ